MMCRPPSTISVVPVMKEASPDASQTMGQAISSGDAQRPISEVSLRSVRNWSTLLPAVCARPT